MVLFSGPFKFVFRYYSRENKELPAWTDSTTLPARVELRIVDRHGQVFSAPIEIPIFASLSAACFVSQQLMGCPSMTSSNAVTADMMAFGFPEKLQ